MKAETEAEKHALKAWTEGEPADMRDLSADQKVVRGAFLAALLRNDVEKDSDAFYKDFVLLGATVKGDIDISHAKIRRNLNFWEGCQFDSGFRASWAQLRALSFNESRINGCLDLFEAKLAGPFSAEGGHFEVESGNAILAQAVEASGWFMNDTPEHQTKVIGTLFMEGVKLAGQFSAGGAHFDGQGGDAIFAQGVEASGWFMRATPEHQTKVIGTLHMNRAKLAGQFNASGADFDGNGGNAIDAQDAAMKGWFLLPRGPWDPKVVGTVYLENASISIGLFARQLYFAEGRFDLENASIRGRIDFHADRMTGELLARQSTVSGEARFIGQFDCHLDFRGARIAHLALQDQFGGNKEPRQFEFSSGIRQYFTAYTNSVNLSDVEVGDLYLPPRCPTGGIDLSRAKIGVLHDTKESWIPGTRPIDRWSLDYEDTDRARVTLLGLEYETLANPFFGSATVKDRIDWLIRLSADSKSYRFNSQPWKQLAKTMRQMDYEEEAEEVTLYQRNAYVRSRSSSLPTKASYWLLDTFGGYGLRPARTAYCSVFLITLSWFFFGLVDCSGNKCFDGKHFIPMQGAEVRTLDNETWLIFDTNFDHGTYPSFDALLYSIDLFIPLVEFGITEHWAINDQYATVENPAWYQRYGVLLKWWATFLRLIGAFLSAYFLIAIRGSLLRQRPSN
ncbi:MAG: hypothetical protein AAFX52_09330 [Pseudomonadota bacterium]